MDPVPSKIRKRIEWLFRRAEGALLPDALSAAEGSHLGFAEARTKLRASLEDVARAGYTIQFERLERALEAAEPGARAAYIGAYGVCGVRRFVAGDTTRIYLLPVETFPHHINNVYVILEAGTALMLDCGSGLDTSRRDLAFGFAVVREMYAEDVRYELLDWCVVSHAHIDHFGGCNLLRDETRAQIAVHELDARVLACFDERLILVSKDIDVFWRRAGVPPEKRREMLDLYGMNKQLFKPMEVDRSLRDADTIGPGYRVHHVPGHCPGQVCLQIHDVLLTSDHVLARITPHQFPEAITPWGGLEHYFHSLAKIRRLDRIAYALGGHEEPILNLRARIDAIAAFHKARLGQVLELCREPRTVVEVSQGLFGAQEGYGPILALDEAGAHVEYLHNLGKLRVHNLDEVAASDDPVMRYVTR